jgi:hypothetical protein
MIREISDWKKDHDAQKLKYDNTIEMVKRNKEK